MTRSFPLNRVLFSLMIFSALSAVLADRAVALDGQYDDSSTRLFRYHLSGTVNPFNPKLTVQLELPIRQRMSYGGSLSYYFINWKGPLAEPFLRLYGKRHGNERGSFFQFKLIYGNLSTLDYEDYEGALKNERWNTYGAGLAYGYKFKLNDRLTLEPLGGIRLLTPPYYIYNENVDESLYASIAEGVIWYVTTGFPIDVQLKVGVQF